MICFNRPRSVRAITGLLVILTLAVVACSSSPTPQPTTAPIDLEQLNALVREAVEEAVSTPPEPISRETVVQLVETAIAASTPSGITADEVKETLDAAIADAASRVVKAELEELVARAVADAAVGSSQITAAEVERLIADEMASMATSMAAMSAPAPEPKETIVFSDLNWESAQLQNRIAMFIVEHGYGHPVDVTFGDTNSLWPSLLNGDTQVTMEVWLPNQQEAWDEAISAGSVISLGKSLDDNWQSAFVVPTYVVEDNPGLKSVEDLRAFKGLFATQESGDKARLMSCVIGWRCKEINEQVVAAYGLDDVIELVSPTSASALFASIEDAHEKREPWLGYMWGPTRTAAELDLTLLDEPTCSPETEPGAGNGCAYPNARVLIAAHASLATRAPEVVEFLRKWNFTAASQLAVEGWMADNGATIDEAAIWFLENNDDVWTQWVSSDIANKVNEALLAAG